MASMINKHCRLEAMALAQIVWTLAALSGRWVVNDTSLSLDKHKGQVWGQFRVLGQAELELWLS